jgi:hypothetical protein
MSYLIILAQAGVGEYTIVSGAATVIGALTGAVTYLWRRAEKEFDECKKDRAKLWEAVSELQGTKAVAINNHNMKGTE